MALFTIKPIWALTTTLIEGASFFYPSIPAGITLLTLYIYLYLLRRSGGLLRWMRPEDGLQKLRRRVHRPLATKAAFDANAGVDGPYKPVAYAIHADDADGPFERFVEGILREEGHRRTPEGEEPQHHVAILSNCSSAACFWLASKGLYFPFF